LYLPEGTATIEEVEEWIREELGRRLVDDARVTDVEVEER
jgi:hypothetical protein